MRKLNIYDILFLIFFVLAVITALWFIFGNGPTLEQSLLILIISFLFKIQSNVVSNTAELKVLRRSFFRLVDDFRSGK